LGFPCIGKTSIMNIKINISNEHGSDPLVNKAIETAYSLGSWPADISVFVSLPSRYHLFGIIHK
jgi:hypothetical protein